MNNILIGNILGAILQPIYLTLFMIFAKKINSKKIEFITLSIIDYFIIQNIVKFNFGINADLFYLILFYVNMKFLFKEKARISDIITYILEFLIMGIVSIIFVNIFGFRIKTILLTNLVLILLVVMFKDKLYFIEKFYNKFWNRHDFKFLKSVTIRGFSAVLTIFTFLILHFWLIYGIIISRR